MKIQNLIQWCTANNAFINLILSLSTIIISIIAIIVSLTTARLPYKKKIKLSCGIAYNGASWMISINAVNIGNRAVKIEMIGLLINSKQLFDKGTIGSNQITLNPAAITTHYINCGDLQHICGGIAKETIVYAYVTDSEGKTYKEKTGTVADLIRNCKSIA